MMQDVNSKLAELIESGEGRTVDFLAYHSPARAASFKQALDRFGPRAGVDPAKHESRHLRLGGFRGKSKHRRFRSGAAFGHCRILDPLSSRRNAVARRFRGQRAGHAQYDRRRCPARPSGTGSLPAAQDRL